jgi:DNA-binding beta-propeller fold protein YncE
MKMGVRALPPAIVKRITQGIRSLMIIRLTIILLFFSLNNQAQNVVSHPVQAIEDDPFIKWIDNLPDSCSSQNAGFFTKIFNFITGYEPVILKNPVYVYADNKHNYFIANQGSGDVVQSKDGEIKILPAFKKEVNYFPSMVSICSFSGGNFLFTDSKLNKIFILSSDGKNVSSLNNSLALDRPTGIAILKTKDEIWVVETGLHRISVLNFKGELKRIIGKRGTGNLEFNFPTYIWIDSGGRIYIVDSMNFRVQVLSSEGNFITSFGKQGDVTGSFARPRGIATDSKGNIYVVDALFNTIQIFDLSGNLLYYFGSQGTGKYQFWMPSGIFIDKEDYIYVSDSYNSRVQIFRFVKND